MRKEKYTESEFLFCQLFLGGVRIHSLTPLATTLDVAHLLYSIDVPHCLKVVSVRAAMNLLEYCNPDSSPKSESNM